MPKGIIYVMASPGVPLSFVRVHITVNFDIPQYMMENLLLFSFDDVT